MRRGVRLSPRSSVEKEGEGEGEGSRQKEREVE